MRKHLPFLIFALALPCLAQQRSTAPRFLQKSEVVNFIFQRHAAGKTVVFVSRDGKIYGMDSDSVISFEPEGRVVLGEFGAGIAGYGGTYQVAKDGSVSISLKGYRAKWPEMRFSNELGKMRLYAPKSGDGFVMGGRGGAVEMGGMRPFWPFFLVDGARTPQVTPVWSGGEVKMFISPQLPPDFKWGGSKASFRLNFTISPEGKASVSKANSGPFEDNDWRTPSVKVAIQAVENWSFNPPLEDGKPVARSAALDFTLSRVEDSIRWIVQDNGKTLFDNVPGYPTAD
ncbi:energy transducer TonB [Prosthecobacter vanneervenii]|uniref:TonB C-terminal domain-containing protein n=1 Tax=Prosthecobacter vanneervenii TaxID=48466 RepID=A0A7W7Y8H3_9BACT|nr:hypothetical protein [Prosthecobacter vanneervenii]MBB5031185.1 hypothetical protein [Prosthecobacter vanneervenii]